jgi:hypothetical protein
MRRAAWIVCLGCTCLPGFAQSTTDGVIEQVRENSLNFDKHLPNFLCQEVVKRFVKPHESAEWQFLDVITAQLTYFESHEEYRQIRINDKPMADGSLGGIKGAMAQGEFGTLVKDLFLPSSQAKFDPDGRAKIHGRPMSKFRFDVLREHSHYRLLANGNVEYVAAYRGQIWVDDETKMVMRLEMSAYGIPFGFPVRSVSTTLDYEFTKVGANKYLLPAKAEIVSAHHSQTTKNLEEFRQYRKFGVETNLSFDVGDVKAN